MGRRRLPFGTVRHLEGELAVALVDMVQAKEAIKKSVPITQAEG